MSPGEIGRRLGVARRTVQGKLARAWAAGLSLPLPADLHDDALAGRLFARSGALSGARRRPEPNWGDLVVELKRPGVTMAILWEEYRAIHPQGYGYSRF
jgi:transposase